MLYLLGLAASFVVLGSAASSGLDVVDLPLGFMPEGIARGDGWTAYVGNRLDGSIWRGDLTTGEGEIVVPAVGTLANGLDYDERSGYLYVAGGDSGTVRVYDSSFDLVVDLALAGANVTSFVNDIIVTRTAVYITDSFNRNLYKIPLDEDGGTFTSTEIFETIQLSDNFPVEDGAWYANGIEETDEGMLIIANNEAAELYLVDPSTGEATLIDIGGEIIYGDGLVLRKNTLWVVDIQAANIKEISLSPDRTCGAVAPRVLTNKLFDYPTTMIRKYNSLYVVSAKFEVLPDDIPMTPYEIVRVDRDSGEYACSA